MAPRKSKQKKAENSVEEQKPKTEYNFDAEMKREEYERKLKKWIKIFIGALFCVGGAWLIVLFWPHFVTIFKQWIGVFVILIGLFIILLGALD